MKPAILRHLSLVDWLDRHLYREYQEHWDTKLFAEVLHRYLNHDHVVLDLGAGRGHLPELDVRGRVQRVIGADPDDAVLSNQQVHEGHVLDGSTLPFEDNTFDVMFSTYVWEHVEFLETFLREARRVLKPGGLYLSLTPNKRHYVGVISTLTPHAFHEWFNALRGRDTEDTFPTYHRLNTRAAIERTARESGFRVRELQAHEHRPEYLRFSTPTYMAGIAWERAVNASPRFEALRVSLVAVLQAT